MNIILINHRNNTIDSRSRELKYKSKMKKQTINK